MSPDIEQARRIHRDNDPRGSLADQFVRNQPMDIDEDLERDLAGMQH